MDSNVAFEAVPTDTSVNMTVSVDFEGVGISVVNKRMQELVYMSFRGLELRYVDTATSYSASVNCKWIQIDNQLFGGIYPIIFYPSVAPKDGKDLDSHPTLQSSVIVLKDESASALLSFTVRSLPDPRFHPSLQPTASYTSNTPRFSSRPSRSSSTRTLPTRSTTSRSLTARPGKSSLKSRSHWMIA